MTPHNGGIEPDWEWISTDEAKRQAVERVSANHENIVKFAARGAGQPGFPPVSAPLADPNAISDDGVRPAVDSVLRAICVAILNINSDTGDDQRLPDDTQMNKVANVIVEEGGVDYARAVIESLAYMRDRVGVPRDMTLPAARQWRAHTNWAIGKIEAALN